MQPLPPPFLNTTSTVMYRCAITFKGSLTRYKNVTMVAKVEYSKVKQV